MEQHRVALVTGGTRGIGAAIIGSLAADGTHVAAGYSSNREAADDMAANLAAKGHAVSLHQGNIGKPEDCQRVVAEVLGQHDHVDYLINNAGITVDKTVRNMTVEDWHAVLRVNLSGAFYMSKAVLEHMIGRGFGRIVNISSIIGETGSIGQANYAAAKSGLFGLTKSLALETARKGITVNCVAPGFIDTEMVAAVPKEALELVIANIPMRRLGRPEEIAHAVRFLLQDDAAYITGSVISVNGGMEM
jgi:acetoacetyl-CoA reductase